MSMGGKADGSPQTTQSASRSCRCDDRETPREEEPAGHRAVSPRSVHRPFVSLSLSHLAQAQPRGDCNGRGTVDPTVVDDVDRGRSAGTKATEG